MILTRKFNELRDSLNEQKYSVEVSHMSGKSFETAKNCDLPVVFTAII